MEMLQAGSVKTDQKVALLVNKVAELETTMKFILSWLKIDKKDLPLVPKFLNNSEWIMNPNTSTGNECRSNKRANKVITPSSRGPPAPKSVKKARELNMLIRGNIDNEEWSGENSGNEEFVLSKTSGSDEENIFSSDPLADDGDWDDFDQEESLNIYDDDNVDKNTEESVVKLEIGEEESPEKTLCEVGPKVCSFTEQNLIPYVLLTKQGSTSSGVGLNVSTKKAGILKRPQSRGRKQKILNSTTEDQNSDCAHGNTTDDVTEGERKRVLRKPGRRLKAGNSEENHHLFGNFACQDCDETFSSKSLVERHQVETGHKVNRFRERKTCEYCGIKSYGGIRFLTHLRMHAKEKEMEAGDHKCEMCNATFSKKSQLEFHKKKMGHRTLKLSSMVQRNCEYCDFKTYGAVRFAIHMDKHRKELGITVEGEGELACQVCNATFPTYNQLHYHRTKTGHRQFKSGVKIHTCEHCDYKTDGDVMFLRHMKSHTMEETNEKKKRKIKPVVGEYACKVCDAKFSKMGLLKDHRTQTGHKSSKRNMELKTCEYCDFKAYGAVRFALHMEKHAKEQGVALDLELACQVCKATFPTYNQLKYHRLKLGHRQFKSGGKIHTCEHCDFKTYSEVLFNRHLRKHKKEKEANEQEKESGEGVVHACQVCNATFENKNQLLSHKIKVGHKTRRGKRTCEYCGYRTYGGYRFLNHLRKHTKINTFLCSICGKALRTENNLKSHMKSTHETQVKQYQCKYCDSMHKTQALLKIHEQIHEGKRDRICPHCGKLVSSLARHIIEVHEKIRSHECHLCDHKFKKKSHLNRHVASHSNPNRRVKSYHVERPHLNVVRTHAKTVPRVTVSEGGEGNWEVDDNCHAAGNMKKDEAVLGSSSAVDECVTSFDIIDNPASAIEQIVANNIKIDSSES